MKTPKDSSLPSPADVQAAVRVLHAGGVIAYATEGVWGLGCDPFNENAVRRVLDLKQRSEAKGLIMIAATVPQLESFLAGLDAVQREAVLATWPGPYTWIVPVVDAPLWLSGAHKSLAVRVSAHAGVQQLCLAWGAALVSTSANRSGQPALLSAEAVHDEFGSELDFILPGELGGDARPSEIRDAVSGVVLRAR
ncbi:MAG: Sua5/YciO/YrdC/YwlC family protein [Moraxellaceae bacterium]